MKQFLAVACLAVLALVVMDSGQVGVGPTGLTIKGGQAMAADMAPPERFTRSPLMDASVRPSPPGSITSVPASSGTE